MKRRNFVCNGLGLGLGLGLSVPLAGFAQSAPGGTDTPLIRPAGHSTLDEFAWIFRPIVIFADTAADPRYSEQLDRIRSEMDELAKRDVIVLTDAEPAAKLPLRQKLRPRGFQMVLVGKDSKVLLRKPAPLTVREITRSIDKLPSRQREVEERRGS